MIEMTKEIKEYVSFRRKLTNINYARDIGSNIEAIRTFKISRSTCFKWKKAFDKDGPQGLLRMKPKVNTHPNKIKTDVVEKVLELRKEYQLGSWRIKQAYVSTVLFYNDIPMEIVSQLLGHSSISITEDSYGKVVKKKIRNC